MLPSEIALTINEQLPDGLLLINSVTGNEHANVGATLDRGADVDVAFIEEPLNRRTPLRAACAHGNIKLARYLLARGADVFAHFSADGWTALHSACQGGHDNVATMLLSEVESLHENVYRDGWGMMHIVVLCLSHRLLDSGAALVRWLLKHMPKIKVDIPAQRAGFCDWTPLHLASARGLAKVCVELLRAKANVHASTNDFHVRSLTHNRLAKGDEEAVVCMGAGFSHVEPRWLDKGLLPIHLAAFGGHLRTLQLLVRQSNPINAMTHRHRWTPLMYGVWSNDVKMVQEICRVGGRRVINQVDRRGDGSEWTPLALAVVRSSAAMVRTLITYGADPLVRISSSDFPGNAFVQHCSLALADAQDNQWSSSDSRISLLHLAVVRGCIDMLQALIPLIREAHLHPVFASKTRQPLTERRSVPSKSNSLSRLKRGTCIDKVGVTSGDALGLSRGAISSRDLQDQARDRITSAPASEAQHCDPVAFCSAQGWSPAVLAVVLHTVDPRRQVSGIELVRGFPDELATPCTRADIFWELLRTGNSLLEDRPEASPPTMPQRFPDVSQTLVTQIISEFAQLCKAGDADRLASRILHTTLCIACRFNTMQVVRHLLQTGLCDPRCPFLRPIECRPLHIATSCGFGYLAQLLLDHKADPLEADDHQEKPVFKLARCYGSQISELQARVSQLEARLSAFEDVSMASPMISLSMAPSSPSKTGRKYGGGPIATPRYDSVLHDSRM